MNLGMLVLRDNHQRSDALLAADFDFAKTNPTANVWVQMRPFGNEPFIPSLRI
jgi:hypothetical protein